MENGDSLLNRILCIDKITTLLFSILVNVNPGEISAGILSIKPLTSLGPS